MWDVETWASDPWNGLTWSQFLLWTQYYAIEPFGEERADLRDGILGSLYVNAHLPKGRAACKPSDIMPYLRAGEITREQSLTEEEKYQRDLAMWENFVIGKRAQALAESMKRTQ